MPANIDKYRKDLDALLEKGLKLHNAMQSDCFPEEFEKALKRTYGKKAKEVRVSLPSFKEEYRLGTRRHEFWSSSFCLTGFQTSSGTMRSLNLART